MNYKAFNYVGLGSKIATGLRVSPNTAIECEPNKMSVTVSVTTSKNQLSSMLGI